MTEKLNACQNCGLPDTNVGNTWNKYPEVKPKDGQECLCFYYGRFIVMSKYCDRKWQNYDTGGELINVSHWQPLPEPPKENEDD